MGSAITHGATSEGAVCIGTSARLGANFAERRQERDAARLPQQTQTLAAPQPVGTHRQQLILPYKADTAPSHPPHPARRQPHPDHATDTGDNPPGPRHPHPATRRHAKPIPRHAILRHASPSTDAGDTNTAESGVATTPTAAAPAGGCLGAGKCHCAANRRHSGDDEDHLA